jgi:uncharacterized protein GlcG (DUF336 family)
MAPRLAAPSSGRIMRTSRVLSHRTPGGSLEPRWSATAAPLASKAFTAAREPKEPRDVGETWRAEGLPMPNSGDLRHTASAGGVASTVDGEVIGAVGVSGLSEHDDAGAALVG